MIFIHIALVILSLVFFACAGWHEGRTGKIGEAVAFLLLGILCFVIFFRVAPETPHRMVYVTLGSTIFVISGFIEGRFRKFLVAGLVAVPTIAILLVLLVRI